jgi:hypothetical protein
VSTQPLRCPSCAREYPGRERFCDACGMPLVADGRVADEPSPARRRARKIKSEYAQGRAVAVHRARDPAQAELVAGLLLEEGIPSYISSVVTGHGQLWGERDVLVPESGAQAAREMLSPSPRRAG